MSITAERLKERRKAVGMSADEVAAELGVSRSTIFRYENGYIEKIPVKVIDELASILRTTPEYLMGWSDEPYDWEQVANDAGICPPNDYDGDPEDWYKMQIHHEDDILADDFCEKNLNKEKISPFVAKNDIERKLLMVCRKAGDASSEEKEAILKNFEATIDMYLRAKGIKKE